MGKRGVFLLFFFIFLIGIVGAKYGYNTIDVSVRTTNNNTYYINGSNVNLTTTTCSGTDKVVSINNATGVVTCDTDVGSDTFVANYSDFLNIKGLVTNDTFVLYSILNNGTYSGSSDTTWLSNWTSYNTTWSLDTDTFVANYSDFLNKISWSDVNNGTILDVNKVEWADVNNGTITGTDATWLANWTAYNTTWSTDLDTDTFVANYTDFLNKVAWIDINNGTIYDPNKVEWSDVNNGTIITIETNWNANYSDFLNKISWSDANNGTIFDVNKVEWADIGNGTLTTLDSVWTTLSNGTLITLDVLNNGTYIVDNILNNGTYSAIDTDTFVANYSDFLNKVNWGDVNNGTIIGTDATWLANWTAYNTTWSTDLDTDTFVDNYTDFLNKVDWSDVNNGTIIGTDATWLANWTAYNTTWSTDLDTDTFAANYTDFLNKINWADANNGTIFDVNKIEWADVGNGTLTTLNSIWTTLSNGTLVTLDTLNNGTYITDDILNNGTYSVIDTDTFVSNYTDFLNKVGWADVNNGTIEGTDTTWLANWTAYNTTWSTDLDTDTFVANYTDFLNKVAWSNVNNGTIYDPNKVEWSDVNNGTIEGVASPAGSVGEIQFNSGSGTLGANSTLFWDFVNGFMGIGKNSPDVPLEVVGNMKSSIGNGLDTFFHLEEAGVHGIRFYLNGTSNTLQVQTESTSSYSDALAIPYIGALRDNVGIGTLTPQNKLNVIGDINSTGTIYALGQNLSELAGTDATWLANWTAYNTTWSTDLDTDTFVDNYTDFLNIKGLVTNDTFTLLSVLNNGSYVNTNLVNWLDVNNGTITAEETLWNANYSDFLITYGFVTNDTFALLSVLNNGTYSVIDTDTFVTNYTDFLNKVDWSDVNNGTITGTDATWLANWTAYNTTWSLDTDTFVANYTDFLTIQSLVTNNTFYGSDNPDSFTTEDTIWTNVNNGTIVTIETNWNANYTDFLNKISWSDANNGTIFDINKVEWSDIGNGTLATADSIWATLSNGTLVLYTTLMNGSFINTDLVNWADVNNGTITAEETLWNANYTDFLNKVAWANVNNGTIFDIDKVEWADANNGTIVDVNKVSWSDVSNGTLASVDSIWSTLSNSTVVLYTTLNNGTYIVDTILNNGTYSAVDTDTFVANYTDFLNKVSWADVNNGTISATDATWLSNWTAYNTTWSLDTDTFVANYSSFLNVESLVTNDTFTLLSVLNNGSYVNTNLVNWLDVNNGTITAEETLWNANYSDFLITYGFVTNDTFALLSILNNGTYSVIDTDTFVANYTDFLNKVNWADIGNGTVATEDSIWNTLSNDTLVLYTTLNNGTYVVDTVLNNGSYFNGDAATWGDIGNGTVVFATTLNNGTYSAVDTDTFVANYTDFLNKINWADANNGTILDVNKVEWADIGNGTLATLDSIWVTLTNGTLATADTIWTSLSNGTVVLSSELNNGTYVVDNVLNNGSYVNTNLISWIDANNGTIFDINKVEWSDVGNGTLATEDSVWATLSNGTIVFLTTLNNGTYITDTVLNNGTYANINTVDWADVNNGTINPPNKVSWADVGNGTLATADSIWSDVTNGTIVLSSELNNGTYVVDNILNNGTYTNYAWNSTNESYRLNNNNTFNGGSVNVTAGNVSLTGRNILYIDPLGCANMVSGEMCRNATGVFIKG